MLFDNFDIFPKNKSFGRSEYYKLYITETQMFNDYVRFTEFEQKFKNEFVLNTIQNWKNEKKH